MTTSLFNLQALCDYFQCSESQQRAHLLDNFLTDLTNGQTRIQNAWQPFSALHHNATQPHTLYRFKEAICLLKGCICQGHTPELNACCNQLYENVCQQIRTRTIKIEIIAPCYEQLMRRIDDIFKEQFDHWLNDESESTTDAQTLPSTPPQQTVTEIYKNTDIDTDTNTKIFATTATTLQLLVVEDNHVVSNIVVSLLRQVAADCHITVANNVAEARQCIQQHSYDGILLDLGLPDGEGLDIAKALNTSPDSKNQQAPIVVSTAHANEAIHQQCLAAGVKAVWIKPFHINQAKKFILLCRQQNTET